MKTLIYKVTWGPQESKGLYSMHTNIDDAMITWSKLCSEINDQIDVYVEKHTSEVVVARRNVPGIDE